jgi:hypothetical protein
MPMHLAKVDELTGLVRREDDSLITGLYAGGRCGRHLPNVYVGVPYADCSSQVGAWAQASPQPPRRLPARTA